MTIKFKRYQAIINKRGLETNTFIFANTKTEAIRSLCAMYCVTRDDIKYLQKTRKETV